MARKLILIPGSIRRSLRRPHPTTMDGLRRSHLRTCDTSAEESRKIPLEPSRKGRASNCLLTLVYFSISHKTFFVIKAKTLYICCRG